MDNKAKNANVAKKTNFKWTEEWDNLFLEALIHQQSTGNRTDNVFTTKAYNNVLKELREKIGNPFQKCHLKNRLKTLKSHFKDCNDIFKDVDGFTWSPETKMWRANPDSWKALIEAKPDSKKWMTTPVANYDKMVLLFAKERIKQEANLQVTLGKKDAATDSIDLVMSENETIHAIEDLNGISDGANRPPAHESVSQTDSQLPSQSDTSLTGKKRKASVDAVFQREFESIREAIKDVAEAIREGNIIAERGRPRVYSESEVFAELVNIGVDCHLHYRAYLFLIANPGRVRAFFGCPAQERKKFLLHMMTCPQSFL